MDGLRRAELIARRDAMIERTRSRTHSEDRAAFVRMVPILRALEEAGDDYDSSGYLPLPGVFNRWAHSPDRWPIRVDTCSPLPTDPKVRDGVILAALRARAGEDGPITVILRSEELVLRLGLPVLARHLATLLENGAGREIGFAAPPANWIVEVGGHGIAIGTLEHASFEQADKLGPENGSTETE
jgi:hypothetical protein